MNAQPPADRRSSWPIRLAPGALRFARASAHYEQAVAYYRDLVGLPVIGEFVGSFDTDGTIFGLPDSAVQLEIVRGHRREAGEGDGSDQLVLYLDGAAAVDEATATLRAAGLLPDPQPHAYWAANGAVTFRDPDDRAVIFAPWVFGRDPEPADQAGGNEVPGPEARQEIRLEWFDGDREDLRLLFSEAEDSSVRLAAYVDLGRVLVAREGGLVVGHLQLVATEDTAEIELKSMAVDPARRGSGIGRLLVEAAIRHAVDAGLSRMVVSTATADVGNLRFYQRCGFRMLAVERDAFGPASGYPDPICIDGIPLRDRVWFSRELTGS